MEEEEVLYPEKRASSVFSVFVRVVVSVLYSTVQLNNYGAIHTVVVIELKGLPSLNNRLPVLGRILLKCIQLQNTEYMPKNVICNV